jgi:hypothetical protein
MNKIYFFLLIVSFSSCLPRISYLGNSYAPTKEPDLYVDEKSIERPYKIIGKGYPERFALFPAELLQKKALQKAKGKGADAVLITDYFVQSAVANISSVYRTDSLGKGLITTGNSTLSNGNQVDTKFIILFLKYTDHK